MQHRLKERLIGAAVLVMLAVIFIPMLLDNSTQTDSEITETNIPARPDNEFTSRIVPLQDAVPDEPGLEPVQLAEDPGSDNSKLEVATSTERVLKPDPVKIAKVPDSPSSDVGITAWIVQLGSFSSEENANILNIKLRKAGFTAFVEPLQQQSRMIYRVRVGPELLRSDAQSLRDRISKTMSMEGIVIQYP